MSKFSVFKIFGRLFLLFVVFYACKKADQETSISSDDALHQKSMDLLKKVIAQEGRSFVMANNIKTESHAVDQNGNRLSERDLQDRKNARETTTCDDGNGDPIYGFDESVLESCSAYYLCGSGYQVTSSWLITTPLPLTAASSKGRIRLKNSGGTITFTDTNVTPVSITTLSQTNSNYPSDVVYRVTYTSAFISQSTFQGAVNLENGAQLATACSQGPQAISYLSTYVLYIGAVFTNPCSRVDVVYLNPASGGVYGSIAGCNTSSTCSMQSGYTIPNTQDVEFTAVSGGAVNKTVNLNNFDAKSIVTVTAPASLPADNSIHVYLYAGTYTIRYRNNHSCSPAAPWSTVNGPLTY